MHTRELALQGKLKINDKLTCSQVPIEVINSLSLQITLRVPHGGTFHDMVTVVSWRTEIYEHHLSQCILDWHILPKLMSFHLFMKTYAALFN